MLLTQLTHTHTDKHTWFFFYGYVFCICAGGGIVPVDSQEDANDGRIGKEICPG